MTGSLDRDGIVSLLRDLSDELRDRHRRGRGRPAHRGAMALAYDARRATRDVDAVFAPTKVVRDAAAAVAERHDLEEDWLNDAVKGFLPGEDPDPRQFLETPSLRVLVASPRYLLAMKLRAARIDVDVGDIRLLYRLCGFTTVEEGLDLLEKSYPSAMIQPKTQYLLAEIVESLEITQAKDATPPTSPGAPDPRGRRRRSQDAG